MATVEARVRSIWGGIEDAARSGDWRPRTSKLCDWCSFKALCPAFGGTPARDPRGCGRAVDRGRARRLTASARRGAGRARPRRRSGRGPGRVRSASDAIRLSPGRAATCCMTSIATVRAPEASGGRDAGRASPRPRRSRRCRRRAAAPRSGTARGPASARVTSSPLTTTSNRPAAAANGSASMRNDDVTSAIGTPASCRSARTCWAPGCHGIPAATPSATRRLRKSTISSSGRSTPRSWSRARRHHHRVAHQRQAVLVRPDAAVRLDQLGLGTHPVGLGVDEGAVHVPQDGGGQDEVGEGAGHRSIVRGGDRRDVPHRTSRRARAARPQAAATPRLTLGR